MNGNVNALLKKATIEFFLDVLNIDLTFEERGLGIENPQYDVTGIISLLGEKPCNVALRISASTAENLCLQYTPQDPSGTTNTAQQIGEFIRQIAQRFVERSGGGNLVLSNPEVVLGKAHDLHISHCTSLHELFFSSSVGNICLVVAYGE